MRSILHLIDTPGPGGAETVFTDLVLGLPVSGYRSVAVVPGPGWIHETLTAAGHSPIILPSRGVGRLGYLAALRRLIHAHRVDLLHGHLLGAAVYGGAAARLAGVPAVATFHGHADLPEPDRWRWLRFQLINRLTTRVVFVSDALRRAVLAATPLRADRTTVIHNGVDLERFRTAAPAPLRQELRLPPETLLLGALGNIRAPKGHRELLEAAARLAPDLPPWHLVIIGDTSGEVFPGVRARAEALALLDRVTFLGYRDDPAPLLKALDLFVLPSLTEGFSIATVQALAAGVPVVATRSGGPEEILSDGATGRLVPPGDPDALARALGSLLADPAGRRRLAMAGPAAVAERFSRAAMLESYRRIYDAL